MRSKDKCYPSGDPKAFELAGYILLAVGIVMLFACIPGWVWFALVGIALIVVGYILLRISRSWR